MVAISPTAARRLFDSYRPEKHYMRGPGPKSIGMIGERFRAETENITREPVPQRWLELMQSLEQHESTRSERHGEQGGERSAKRGV